MCKTTRRRYGRIHLKLHCQMVKWYECIWQCILANQMILPEAHLLLISIRYIFRPLSLNVVCQHGINGPKSDYPQIKRGRDTVRWFLIKFFWSIITSLVCYVFLELSKLQALFFQTNFYLSLLSLWNFNKCLNSIRKRVFEIIVSRTIDIQVTRSVNNFVPKC